MPRKLSVAERHARLTKAITEQHLADLHETTDRNLPKTARWLRVHESVKPRPTLDEVWAAIMAASKREVERADDRADACRMEDQLNLLRELAAAFNRLVPLMQFAVRLDLDSDEQGKPKPRTIATPRVDGPGRKFLPVGDDVTAALWGVAAVAQGIFDTSAALERAIFCRVPPHPRAVAAARVTSPSEDDAGYRAIQEVSASLAAGRIPAPELVAVGDEHLARTKRRFAEYEARKCNPADVKVWIATELQKRDGWTAVRAARAAGTTPKAIQRQRRQQRTYRSPPVEESKRRIQVARRVLGDE